MKSQLDRIEKQLTEVHTVLHGNGKPGLRLDVDRMKIFIRNLKYVLGVVFGALVVFIGKKL